MAISRPALATLVASIALHAGAAALMRSGFARGVASERCRVIPVEFDAAERADEAPLAAPEPAKPVQPPSRLPVFRPAPMPASRSVLPATVTDAPPTNAVAVDPPARQESEPAHFVLTRGIATTAPTRATPSSDGDGAGTVISEDRVSVPARLLTRVTVAYPPAARANEIEADVRVEIVVDAAGRVEVARCLRPAGYGLDEAAINAVRAYRFSPALVDGRPVRVRMLWTVQFRLG